MTTTIRDIENANLSNSTKSRVSLERLVIVALIAGLGGMAFLWQSAEHKPMASYVITPEGNTLSVKPTDPNARSPEEIKKFAQVAYKLSNTYDWGTKSITCNGCENGIETDIKLGLLKFSSDIYTRTTNLLTKNRAYSDAANKKVKTDIVFRPVRIIRSVAPYQVIVRGEQRMLRNDGIQSFSFGRKYTITPIDRQEPFNKEGLMITADEDLTAEESR